MTVKVGASACTTTTLKVQVVELPVASLAVIVTVFVPTEKAEPDAGSAVTEGEASQLSAAVGKTNVTMALLLEVQTAISAGQATVGAIVSTTFTARVTSTAGLPEGSLTDRKSTRLNSS